MKFKILKGTKTFDALTKLKADIIRAEEAAMTLCKELGGVNSCRPKGSIGGGIEGIDFGVKEKPIEPCKRGWEGPEIKKRGWIKHDPDLPFRQPKVIPQNLDIIKRMNDLPVVYVSRFNSIIPLECRLDDMTHWNLSTIIFAKDLILLDIAEWAKRETNTDLIEILTEEYNDLVTKEEASA